MREQPDTSSRGLAERFGRRTVEMIRDGRDPYEAARLAVGFAERYLDERPKIIGFIGPTAPWGDSPVCYVSDADYLLHWGL